MIEAGIVQTCYCFGRARWVATLAPFSMRVHALGLRLRQVGAIDARPNAQASGEHARKVALIRETAEQRDIGQRAGMVAHQRHRAIDPSRHQPLVRRHARASPERADESAGRQITFASQLNERDAVSQACAHQLLDATLLPRREPTLRPDRRGCPEPAIGSNQMAAQCKQHMIDKRLIGVLLRMQCWQQRVTDVAYHLVAEESAARPMQVTRRRLAVIPAQFRKGFARHVENRS